ncbi:MAG: efflux RND transporter permease subunit [Gemmatimonadetes bacterium]|nr:efflux RND transporter permease subunit [Gemmatimonadota bacterium]
MPADLTAAAVRRPVTTVVVYAAAILLGLYSFYQMGVDFLPDVEVQKLAVKTECPGVAAIDIEEEVTQTIEAALSGLYNIRNMRSVSRDDISMIYLEFSWDADMDLTFIKVRNKLDRIQQLLPDFAARPTILRFDPSSSPFMMLAVTGDRIERPVSDEDYRAALVELKDVAEAVVKPRLEQIQGVAQALVAGGLEKEVQVEIDRRKCLAYGVEFADVEAALTRFNANSAGGTIREGNLVYPLRIEGRYRDIEDIRKVPVKRIDNATVFLEDIATAKYGFKEPTGYNRLNGQDTITLYLYKKSGDNTVKTARKVESVLAALTLEFPDFRVIPIFDESEFIQEAVDNVLSSLYWGGFFAVLVLFLFIRDWKSPLIVGLAVPLSIVITFAVMYSIGIHFNVVSLGGLALGIGILVDNAIIVLDNVQRFRKQGFSRVEAAVEGTREVSLPIAASTFTTVSVFLPLVYIEGLAGALYFDQAITVVASLTLSLLVSITLVSMLLSRGDARGRLSRLWVLSKLGDRADALGEGAMRRYERLLAVCLQNKTATLVAIVVAAGLGLSLLSAVDRELMPTVDRKRLVLEVEFPASSLLLRTLAEVAEIEQLLGADPAIQTVYSSVGITDIDFDQSHRPGANKAVIEVKIAQEADTDAVAARLEALGRTATGYELSVRQPPSFLEHFFPPETSDFDVRLNGEDWGELAAVSKAIVALMEDMPRFAHVRWSLAEGAGGYEVSIDHGKAALYGIDAAKLADFLSREVQGSQPTQLADYSREVDVKLVVRREEALGLETLKRLSYPIRREEQTVYVPVEQLVSISPYAGYAALHRKNQSRTVEVGAELVKGDATEAKRQLEAAASRVEKPQDIWLEIGAVDEEMQEMLDDLSLTLIVSFCLVFAILAAKFESLKIPFVVISVVPLALVCVVATLYATGQTLNFMSAMGAVVLVGIVVNDSIVKVDFIRNRHLAGADLSAAIAEAGRKRLRPIAMTTVTTVLGLLPLALSTGQGAELHQPMAWVIIGGLTLATGLTLIVVPVIYSLVCGRVRA